MERPEATPAERRPPSPGDAASAAAGGGADPARDAELDKELKDTFPASDPVPPKHVD